MLTSPVIQSLYFICDSNAGIFKNTCKITADVYYWAVRAFGRAANKEVSATSIDAEALEEYTKALVALDRLVAEAKARGELE
jgi:hypothetical protein